jgi:uncharacterized protein (DUF1778 family)
MTDQAAEIRVTDSKARLTLPRAFANATLLLEVRSDNEIVIRKAKVVPLGESGAGAETLTLDPTDWAAFMAALDHPPKPNPKLKKLLRDYKPAE